MILRARFVVPINRPPIEDGFVRLRADRIVEIGRRPEMVGDSADADGPMVDLGESILLPGLVNAHCHLDYTDLAGKIPPGKGFTDWIQAMVAGKNAWSDSEFFTSWQRGAGMLLRTGTTTVADIEAVPQLLPQVWSMTPLRVISLRELIHLGHRRPAGEMIEQAVNDGLGLPDSSQRVGLSPHAPYSTTPELLQGAARATRRRRWPLSTHVAESEQEFEMFMYRQGAMYEWLKSQRDTADCGLGSPIQHLERCGYLGANLLAVHVNYLDRHDARLLQRRQVSVAHCPRSHAYFRHLKFPRAELAQAGVNICLGTDSLATVRKQPDVSMELNLFSEMAAFQLAEADVAPAQILAMATVQAARALGRTGELGELKEQALADLITIPFAGQAAELFEAIIHHTGPVTSSMIGGAWAIPPSPS